MRTLSLMLAGLLAMPPPDPRVAQEAAAARRAREQIEDKLGARRDDLRARVRALYKLTFGGRLPLVLDGSVRAEWLRRRAAARRMILRDLEERKLLGDELRAARGAETRLSAQALGAALSAAPVPTAGTLARPVAGRIAARSGAERDEATGARLVRRGIELEARPGAPARAVLAGRVLYAGSVRNLPGQAVLIDHGGGFTSLTAGLAGTPLRRGEPIDRGAPLGPVGGERLLLELRRAGRPVDPAPLLESARSK